MCLYFMEIKKMLKNKQKNFMLQILGFLGSTKKSSTFYANFKFWILGFLDSTKKSRTLYTNFMHWMYVVPRSQEHSIPISCSEY